MILWRGDGVKSKILNDYDLQKAIDEWHWKSSVDEGAVQENIYQVGLKFKSYQPQEDVWEGDIVTVRISGGTKKFNRTAKIRVGNNLFDKTLESAIVGKKVGEEYACSHPTGEIRYTVLDSSRLIVPFVTDEMAQAEKVENVSNVEELFRYYREQSLSEDIYGESYEFTDWLVSLCQYEIADEDVTFLEEREMERCREIAKSQGMVFDEMSEEQLLGAVGCPDIAAFRKMIRELFTKEIRAALHAEKNLSCAQEASYIARSFACPPTSLKRSSPPLTFPASRRMRPWRAIPSRISAFSSPRSTALFGIISYSFSTVRNSLCGSCSPFLWRSSPSGCAVSRSIMPTARSTAPSTK